MSLYSYELEKNSLAALLQYPAIYADVAIFINDSDYWSQLHQTIFLIIRQTILAGEIPDKVMIAEKIKRLEIKPIDDINVFDYVEALGLIQINPKAAIKTFQELRKYTICRELTECANRVKIEIKENLDKTPQEIINLIDQINNKKIDLVYLEENPIEIFEQLEEFILHKQEAPVDEMGLRTPYPIYNKYFGGLREGGVYVWASRAGQGKALEENTLIPTPCGFKAIKDLVVGDLVFAVDGTPTNVLAVQKWTNRPTFKVITKDKYEIIADENHLWKVRIRSLVDNKWETLTTRQLFESKKRRRFLLPEVQPLQLPHKELPIDPYVLGVWLGDGTSANSNITKAHVDAEFFVQEFKRRGFLMYRKSYGKYLYGVEKLQAILRLNNLLNNKHIPSDYLRASESQRLDLLRGLVDTDGSVDMRHGQIELSTSIERLSIQYSELINSLGIKCHPTFRMAKCSNGKLCPSYRLEFYGSDVALLPRKAMRLVAGPRRSPCRVIAKIEPCQSSNTVCIEVAHESHLFLCGRGMIPTHNSSILSDLSRKASQLAEDVRVLYLDTEMNSEDVMLRTMSAISGVPFWYLDTGQYRDNPEMKQKVDAALAQIRANKISFSHKYVANRGIDDIISIIKRWYLSKCGRSKKAIVVYDYLKLTGEKISNDWKEYQVLGEKTNRLKECATEIKAPLLAAIQINRSGVFGNKEGGADDESVIAISDRISWFASYLGIFRRKTTDEITQDGSQHGTHKLITLKARFQGRESYGHHDLVRVPKGDKHVYKMNFINYNVQNFNVEECGCLRDMVANQLHIESDDSEEESEL